MSPIISGGSSSGGSGSGALALLSSVVAAGGETVLDTGAGTLSQTGNHLLVVILSRHGVAENVNSGGIRFNNDSAANYGTERMRVNNATATAAPFSGATSCGLVLSAGTNQANEFAATTIWIPGYTATQKKRALCQIGSLVDLATVATYEAGLTTGEWSGTAAITRVQYVPPAALIAGSAMYVYRLT